MSTGTQIVDATDNNLFDDVSGAESAAGDVEYRGHYILNNHGTLALQNAKIYISVPTSPAGSVVEIGVAAEDVNTTMATIADETTAPSSVTFSAPTTYAAGLNLNTGAAATGLVAGARRGVWTRRTVSAGASAAAATVTLKVEGDTAA